MLGERDANGSAHEDIAILAHDKFVRRKVKLVLQMTRRHLDTGTC